MNIITKGLQNEQVSTQGNQKTLKKVKYLLNEIQQCKEIIDNQFTNISTFTSQTLSNSIQQESETLIKLGGQSNFQGQQIKKKIEESCPVSEQTFQNVYKEGPSISSFQPIKKFGENSFDSIMEGCLDESILDLIIDVKQTQNSEQQVCKIFNLDIDNEDSPISVKINMSRQQSVDSFEAILSQNQQNIEMKDQVSKTANQSARNSFTQMQLSKILNETIMFEKIREVSVRLENLQLQAENTIKQLQPQDINEERQEIGGEIRQTKHLNVPKRSRNIKTFKMSKKKVQTGGEIVTFGDENWNKMVNIMLGIQKAVQSVENEPELEITPQHYKLKCRHDLITQQFGSKKQYQTKMSSFEDYAPSIFKQIRQLSGIITEQYIQSLGCQKVLVIFIIQSSLWMSDISTLNQQVSSGKSGSLFFFSEDGNYVIKTISKTEFRTLIRILPNYHNHLKQYPKSLITRFYGCHKLIFQSGKSKQIIYFTVMNNIFSSMEVHRRFDLKGSTYGRTTKQEDRNDSTISLKDLDFLEMGQQINIGEPKASKLLLQLQNDSQFFARCQIIDYSVLLGFHFEDEAKENIPQTQIHEDFEDYYLFRSQDKKTSYIIGIIDILTFYKQVLIYSTKKKAEHFFKGLFASRHGISCVPPDIYARRFFDFMQKIIK